MRGHCEARGSDAAARDGVVFVDGDVIIHEGEAPKDVKVMYIQSGVVSLRRGEKEVKRAGAGDILGEMTMLLGDTPNVTIVAEETVQTFEVTHSNLVQQLLKDPVLAGRVFKMLAVLISERIAETSARARDEVMRNRERNGPHSAAVVRSKNADMSAKDVDGWRAIFKLPADEALVLKTSVSMKKEEHAKKDDSVTFGEMYVFAEHLCFQWKTFGFSKSQVVPLKDVVALLHEEATPDVVEVELKGLSYELTLPSGKGAAGFKQMEAARPSAPAGCDRQPA